LNREIDRLETWIQFKPSLVDPVFVLLLAAAIIARPIVPARGMLIFGACVTMALIAASTSWRTLVLGLALAWGLVYPATWMIVKAKAPASGRRVAVPLALALIVLIGLWISYKVLTAWAPETWRSIIRIDDTGSTAGAILGFSYFLFRAINYLWIHSLTGQQPAGPLKLAYYLLFPATLESGPIHKYSEFSREVDARRRLTWEVALACIERLNRGYFYQICLGALCLWARNELLAIGELRGQGSSNAPGSAIFLAWESLGIIATQHLYIFFDFCGYSHIAIAIGLLLGIRVPENFRQPFTTTTMAEFWRNWHITLGDWFRDHVFIPLGGMRATPVAASLIAAMIMFISGLWHGLTLPFVLWGLWHAAMIFIDGMVGLKPVPPADRSGMRYWGRVVLTNARVWVASLLFLPTLAEAWPVLEGLGRWW
jgi:alginate O-acetyltransferase complex protein AlgI